MRILNKFAVSGAIAAMALSGAAHAAGAAAAANAPATAPQFLAMADTRSADAMPAEQPATTDSSDKAECQRNHGHWDSLKLRCRHGAQWWLAPAALVAGGTGFAISALVSSGNDHDHSSVSN